MMVCEDKPKVVADASMTLHFLARYQSCNVQADIFLYYSRSF